MSSLMNAMPMLLQATPDLPKSPPGKDFWMPADASVTTSNVDWLYDVLLWTSLVSGVAVVAVIVAFVVKYRVSGREGDKAAPPGTTHNTALEVTWSVLPMFLLVAVFVWGFQGFVALRTPPKDAIEVHATGQKWKWLFTYPNGYTDSKLHVPVNKPVRVIIESVDVLHSLYIPAFRQKMDAVPGRYTDLWFEATKVGEFPIFCTEYCGTSHSDMLSEVVVHEPGGYEEFLEKAEEEKKTMEPALLGQLLYNQAGCAACHTVDGSPKLAPTWKGIFGTTRPLSDGSTVKIDENYIRESILEPQAKVAQGFAPNMPTFKGKLKDYELNGLIAYIKSLK